MTERPELEAVLVTPKHAHSWLEEQTMQAGLGRFMQVFADQGVSERVALALSGGGGRTAAASTPWSIPR